MSLCQTSIVWLSNLDFNLSRFNVEIFLESLTTKQVFSLWCCQLQKSSKNMSLFWHDHETFKVLVVALTFINLLVSDQVRNKHTLIMLLWKCEFVRLRRDVKRYQKIFNRFVTGISFKMRFVKELKMFSTDKYFPGFPEVLPP